MTKYGRPVFLFLLGFLCLTGLFGGLTLAFFPEQPLHELAWVALPALIVEGIIAANLNTNPGTKMTGTEGGGPAAPAA